MLTAGESKMQRAIDSIKETKLNYEWRKTQKNSISFKKLDLTLSYSE